MAKVVRTTDNDYRIIVAEGGTIYLDTTGAAYNGAGKVVVRGDLEVKGDTTTIHSTVSTLQDNILVLNYEEGSTLSGLPGTLDRPYSAGIQIDRGLLAPARWVYDDSVSWDMGGDTGRGAWMSTQGYLSNPSNEQDIPLKITGIVSVGNLYVSVGSNVISVYGSNDYEHKIWYYNNDNVIEAQPDGTVLRDGDIITNAQAVKDFVDYSLSSVQISRLVEDNTSIDIKDRNNVIATVESVGSRTVIKTVGSHGYIVGDDITIAGVTTSPNDAFIQNLNGAHTVTDVPDPNKIEINVNTLGGDPNSYVANSGSAVTNPNLDPTRIVVTVEGDEIANFYQNRVEIADLQILGNEISTYNSNDNLVLSAPGSGTVKIKDTLELTKTPGDDEGDIFDPLAPVEGIKVYSKTPSTGATGLYFVNEQDRRDEIISKNRALLYSMLF